MRIDLCWWGCQNPLSGHLFGAPTLSQFAYAEQQLIAPLFACSRSPLLGLLNLPGHSVVCGFYYWLVIKISKKLQETPNVGIHCVWHFKTD
jgi:hypothetical protein